MARRILISLLGVAVWVGLALGLVRLFTGLDFAALDAADERLVACFLLPAPILVALIAIVRKWQGRGLSRALEGLGLDTTTDDATSRTNERVERTLFEDPHGRRTPIFRLTSPAPAHARAFVVLRRDADLPDYAARMTEVVSDLPAHLALRVASTDTPFAFDAPSLALIAAMPELLQIRVESREARILLARPLTDLRALRRAVALLRYVARGAAIEPAPADEGPRIPDRKPLPIALAGYATVLGLAAIVVLAFLGPDDEGYEAFVLERMHACPLAVQALGVPIRRVNFGFQPSTMNRRDKTSRMLVAGSRREGEITVEAYVRTRGTAPSAYPLYEAVLQTDDEAVEIFSCAHRYARGTRARAAMTGTVRSVRGAAPASIGEACTIAVAPTNGPRACRVEVACARPLYGTTPQTGFTECWTTDDPPAPALVARDLPRGQPRSEPTLDLDARARRLTLGGEHGEWSIDVALE